MRRTGCQKLTKNKNEINRVAFLMRTSFNMLSTNYFKKNNEKETTNERQKVTQKDN
jgi:hypothetical protein